MSASHSDALSDLRLRLLANGYEPLPIVGPSEPVKSAGKRPSLRDWANVNIAPPVVKSWARDLPRDTNTGLRCGRVVGIDIDVLNADLSRSLEDLAVAMLGATPLRRVGNAPKVLLVYRAPEVSPKVETAEFILPDGTKSQVEILAKGQQFVSHGVHPDTRQAYVWTARAPEQVPLADLPIALQARVRAFIAAAESLLRDAGGRTQREIDASRQPPEQRPERAASADGDSFFRRVNSHALANLDAWVKALFPRAYWQANATTPPGAWRVSSKDLGRGLEEDLAIHATAGCQDFGTRESLTPIDVVMRWGGAPDAAQAALWLCEQTGVDAASMGWKGRNKTTAPDEPVDWEIPPLDDIPDHWHAEPEIETPEPEAPPSFLATPFNASELDNLPPRKWVYGHFLIERFLSVLGAPGGTGKTAYAMAVAVSVALNKALLKEQVHEPGNVWIYNLEDPRDEILRRLAAVCKEHKIAPAELAGKLFLDSGRDRPLVVAERTSDGRIVAMPIVAELVAELKARGIRLLIVDPFVKSHRLEENRNEQIDFAASLWNAVAEQAECSILLVHHFRKGGHAGDADAFRGASALIDAARAAVALSIMSEKDADRLGIEDDKRRFYVRADNAKLNLAPPPTEAVWVRLNSVELPNGDKVQAVSRWEPPSPWGSVPMNLVVKILDRIAAGRDNGDLWSPRKEAKEGWAGKVIVDMAKMTDGQAAEMLRAWEQSGLLTTVKFKNSDRQERNGYNVDATKIQQMRQQIKPSEGEI